MIASIDSNNVAAILVAASCFATLALSSTPAMAQSGQNRPDQAHSAQPHSGIPQPDDAYARYYGDGLRHYAEGDFSQAVENLFRAYALESKASTLGLIVTSYDKMGFCDAATRQLSVHRMVHPDTTSPTLSNCASTGAVAISCKGPEAAVTVDRQFTVSCGQRIELSTGEHQLSAERVDSPRRVTVEEGETESVELVFSPAPTRWKTASSEAKVSKLPDAAAQIDRLERGGLDYTVFQSQDGLYRIFIHPGSASSGGVLPLPLRPDVLRLCDSGESFDAKSHSCVPLQGMQIQKME
jgi:hypothetical protein